MIKCRHSRIKRNIDNIIICRVLKTYITRKEQYRMNNEIMDIKDMPEDIIFEVVEENYSDEDMMFGACPPSSRCTDCK